MNLAPQKKPALPPTFIRRADEGPFQLVEPGKYVRDLGAAEVYGDEYKALVIRIDPEGGHKENLHRHAEGFSLAYVLKGWLEVEFKEIGVPHLGPGSVIPAFNGPTHRELACGDELELLLLTTPKNMKGDGDEKVVVQRARESDYTSGYRDDFVFRDFGLRELSGDRITARAIKAVPGIRARDQWHIHDVQFQMLYVAEGWIELDFDDVGRIRLEKGATLYPAPRVRHMEVAHSDDMLLIEIATRGDYVTEAVA